MYVLYLVDRFGVDCVLSPTLGVHVCVSGYVYVDLHSEEQVEKALKKNKDYIGEEYHIICVLGIYWECMLGV